MVVEKQEAVNKLNDEPKQLVDRPASISKSVIIFSNLQLKSCLICHKLFNEDVSFHRGHLSAINHT